MTRTSRPRPRRRPLAIAAGRPALLLPLLSLLAALAMYVAAAPARAAVPQTIAFQGFLTDDGGLPIDGVVKLEVAIYAAASGGTALWSETHNAVPVSKGVFAIALGSVTPLTAAAARTSPRFLGLSVDDALPLPRTELRAAPFALRAQAADTVTAGIDIRQGSTSVMKANANSQAELSLDFYTGGGVLLSGIGADNNGDGELVLFNADHTASMRLSSGQAGDTSVRLPAGSINASELLNEPGLASANNTNFTDLTATAASVLSRTITPPASGHVLALGQAVARINHVNGTATSGAVGLSDDGIAFGTAQDVNVIIASGAASGSYGIPVHVNGVFPAAGTGPLTIHLLGSEASGDIQLEDLSLTLLYVPTSYGTVTQTQKALDDGEAAPAGRPLTPAQVAAEQDQSRRDDLDRIAREIEAARAEHEARLADLAARLEAASAHGR